MPDLFDGLNRQVISAIVTVVLTGVLGGAAALLARGWARQGKVWVNEHEGHTRMSPYILLLGLLCALSAAACLVAGLLNPASLREQGQLVAWAGLIGGFLIACLITLRYARQTWDWDAKGLRWHGAWRSVSMPWTDMRRAGSTWGGHVYVSDSRGRKIVWSSYTLEHEELRAAILARRPDIAVPHA